MIHCSGGGQTKVLHFIDKLHVIKNNLFPEPPLFKLIREQSGTPLEEMYRVFNMGHRMELYVPAEISEAIISISKSFSIDAQIIGYCEAAVEKKLTIISGEERYSF
jgi:phosphoribosylformylglycinamidine cyclo-ligase